MTLTILAIFGLFIILDAPIYYTFWRKDKKKWNNGICKKCEKDFYLAFDSASDGAEGYKCQSCGFVIWLDWYRPH